MWNSGNYSALKDCLYNINVSDGIRFEEIVLGSTLDYSLGNAICWDMVQDNNFFPGVPRTLYKQRTEKPMIIGTCKDEWAYWETARIRENHTAWNNYTKVYAESFIADKFVNFFGDQSQIAIELLENLYIDYGTKDDDYLAWFKFVVD
uniref:Uncharacterized protein n=1 Tax=Acrobeloides nanus TaxID=290746 RepID=A0A914CVA5_9BILA